MNSEIIEVPFPGKYILDYLLENSIYAEDFADDLGITEKELKLILEGNKRIDNDLAIKLSKEIGTSVEVWINLQKSYDEYLILNK